MGRGASAVAKAIALSRPRCVGGLKHQPDPERLKDLFSPVSNRVTYMRLLFLLEIVDIICIAKVPKIFIHK